MRLMSISRASIWKLGICARVSCGGKARRPSGASAPQRCVILRQARMASTVRMRCWRIVEAQQAQAGKLPVEALDAGVRSLEGGVMVLLGEAERGLFG